MNMFLFLSFIFLATLLLGKLIEKIKVPWIFGALILGSLLAAANPFRELTSSNEFIFLAQLGMYFLLFVIGFELDLNELKQQGKLIINTTFATILLAIIVGTPLIYFIFHYSWVISFTVALSFSTVGEAILIPILDEFKIVNTKLGQSIIGVGTLDDIIEVFSLILVVVLIGANKTVGQINIGLILVSLFLLFGLAFGLTKLKKEGKKFHFISIETLFLFVLFILFLFLGIGEYAQASAIGAILAGIALKTFIPNKRIKIIESEIKTMCYGFFAPLFFLWVGITMNINYLFSAPLLIILIVIASAAAKILASWFVAKKELGLKQSIILGIGLSVRFSTGIIVIKILLENNLISNGLYSIIIASSIIFSFIIPVLFSNLLLKWKIIPQKI